MEVNMKKVLVVGSINIDLVATVTAFPKPGETLTGRGFNMFPGGKGANQAVAAARLGADVTILGKIGEDSFGQMAINALNKSNVRTHLIEIEERESTGIALIQVTDSGENSIVVIPGANRFVDVDYVQRNRKEMEVCDVILLQLEIPYETVEWIAEYAFRNGKTVILDPAPARQVSERLLQNISFITPNDTELKILANLEAGSDTGTERAIRKLLDKGVNMVIYKAGAEGAYIADRDSIKHIQGHRVKAVDTTAAGDSFNGGFAYALSLGKNIRSSVEYANAVGAISVTKLGAQSAIPTSDEVDVFLKIFSKNGDS
jgi:ribokinase